LILGLWLGGSLIFAWMSASGMSTAGTALNNLGPKGQMAIGIVGQDSAKQLAKFVVAEVNREFSYAWGWAQVAFGIVLLIAVTFSTRGNKTLMGLAGTMLALALVAHLSAAENITALGRVIDFSRAHEFERERRALSVYHNAYILLELVKFAIGIAVGTILVASSGVESKRRRRRSVADELDEVNHAHHGRVNR
jgi:hypothetical protein